MQYWEGSIFMIKGVVDSLLMFENNARVKNDFSLAIMGTKSTVIE